MFQGNSYDSGGEARAAARISSESRSSSAIRASTIAPTMDDTAAMALRLRSWAVEPCEAGVYASIHLRKDSVIVCRTAGDARATSVPSAEKGQPELTLSR